MKIVGLCGGSGTGKSIACQVFTEYGVDCISADDIYHDMISHKSPCLDEIVANFGEDILDGEALNRRKLHDIVFNSPEKLALLNKITHPHILARIREIIKEYKAKGADGLVIDAPALFESGLNEECSCTVCVYSDIEKRIERIMKRDGISRESATARIYAQVASDYLRRACDFTIENNSGIREMRISTLAVKKRIFDLNCGDIKEL